MLVYENGYVPELDLHYDAKCVNESGNTDVYIVRPKITPEEDAIRWKRFCEVASRIAMEILVEESDRSEEQCI